MGGKGARGWMSVLLEGIVRGPAAQASRWEGWCFGAAEVER